MRTMIGFSGRARLAIAVTALAIAATGCNTAPRPQATVTTGPSASPPLDELSPPQTPTPGIVTATFSGRTLSVPILLYHYIRINPNPADKVGWNLSVTPANFKAQMDYLAQLGAHSITPAQLMDSLVHGAALPSHPVILTFDDGHDDFATQAVPVLLSHHFVGVTYVVPGFLGRRSYMTRQQVQQVDRLGMVVGDHTLNHLALAGLPDSMAWQQIEGGKQALEALLGHPVVDFAYPYGSYSNRTVALVKKAGLLDAVTTNTGVRQSEGSPYTLQRIRVGGGDTVYSTAAKAMLSYQGHPYRPAPVPAPSPSAPLVAVLWPRSPMTLV